jgi:hypothetical protein
MNEKRLKPVWGAEKISEILGVSLRKGFYLLEKGFIPARKVGGCWQSTEGELQDFLLGREAAAAEKPADSAPKAA